MCSRIFVFCPFTFSPKFSYFVFGDSWTPLFFLVHSGINGQVKICAFRCSVHRKPRYCAFKKHANSEVQKPPSQLRFPLLSIIFPITSNWLVNFRIRFFIKKRSNHTEIYTPGRSNILVNRAKLFNGPVWTKCSAKFFQPVVNSSGAAVRAQPWSRVHCIQYINPLVLWIKLSIASD